MNLDLGSFAFGSSLNSGGGTPSWGTALGQSKPDYKFTYPGAEAILIGLVYCSVPLETVSLPLGKGGRIYQASELEECQLASLFRKVYINGVRIDYPFIVILVKEESDSHSGRKSIKYSDKNAYQSNGVNYSNQEFIRQARKSLGLGEDACWFIYNFEVYHQDELHMSAVIVDEVNSVTYENSSERRNSWIDLIPETNDSDYRGGISDFEKPENLQMIYYGAPGTGKSKTIKNNTEKAEKEDRVFRTTFHPDSDYSTFVGCYKPAMKEVPKTTLIGTKVVEVENGTPEEKIVYRFVPQAFTNAYVKAWNTTEDVYLIIEEINRGNCAQIFGDLFQLLDRDDDGKSEYPIDADTDLGSYIAKELESSTRTDFPDGVKNGRKLVLPSNLYIWATMNTSDQSLFPIDSAFKRRWDWKYLPIEDAGKNWKIKVNGNEYDWYKFLEAINKEVLTLTHSEDKQLGYFFAKAKDGVIDAETLVNKVYFYLWTDVFKDYDYESQKAFRKPNSNDPIAFKNFFEDLKNDEKVNEGVAEQVLINLELEKLNKPVDLFG